MYFILFNYYNHQAHQNPIFSSQFHCNASWSLRKLWGTTFLLLRVNSVYNLWSCRTGVPTHRLWPTTGFGLFWTRSHKQHTAAHVRMHSSTCTRWAAHDVCQPTACAIQAAPTRTCMRWPATRDTWFPSPLPLPKPCYQAAKVGDHCSRQLESLQFSWYSCPISIIS